MTRRQMALETLFEKDREAVDNYLRLLMGNLITPQEYYKSILDLIDEQMVAQSQRQEEEGLDGDKYAMYAERQGA